MTALQIIVTLLGCGKLAALIMDLILYLDEPRPNKKKTERN